MRTEQRTVRLTLTEPLRISRSTMAARAAVWFTVAHEGVRGHGEVVSSVYYALDAAAISRQLDLATAELSRYARPEDALAALAEGWLFAASGNLSSPVTAGVRAGVEAALLDLVGKRAGLPVHQLLRGTGDFGDRTPVRAPSVATARTFGIAPAAEVAAQAAELVGNGFSVLKVKAGGMDPAEDLARIRAVRHAAPDARLLLDPNGGWSADRCAWLLPRCAELGVEAVEQPLPPGDPEALAALAAWSPIPVIADEDAVDLADVRRLAGRVQGVNVKLAKCGGVHAALRIAEALAGSGTELMLGCLTASSLGLAPAVHLADRARWADLDGHLLLAHDPWTGIGGTDGTVSASSAPGLGVREAGAREVGVREAGAREGER